MLQILLAFFWYLTHDYPLRTVEIKTEILNPLCGKWKSSYFHHVQVNGANAMYLGTKHNVLTGHEIWNNFELQVDQVVSNL